MKLELDHRCENISLKCSKFLTYNLFQLYLIDLRRNIMTLLCRIFQWLKSLNNRGNAGGVKSNCFLLCLSIQTLVSRPSIYFYVHDMKEGTILKLFKASFFVLINFSLFFGFLEHHQNVSGWLLFFSFKPNEPYWYSKRYSKFSCEKFVKNMKNPHVCQLFEKPSRFLFLDNQVCS